jgi:hypothetical protein
MTKLAELNRSDFKEFVLDMIEAESLDWAIGRIYDNDGLSSCVNFNKTKRGQEYWSNIYWNGYKVALTKEQIEKRLSMQPGTLIINGF